MGRHSSEDDAEAMSVDSEEGQGQGTSGSGSGSSDEDLKRKRKLKKSKHSKKKKSKDKKRHKKKSKKHHRRRSSSSSGGSSEEEDEWVVKEAKQGNADDDKLLPKDAKKEEESCKKKSNLEEKVRRAPTAEDENEWMDFSSTLPTFSNDAKKSERRKQKEKERERASLDNPGVHVNELNPYWKDGGTGLPEEESVVAKPKETQVFGDGGLSYLRRAFIRAKEQAKEEGRSLEDVVSERWGSLEEFLGKLEEAEKKAEKSDDRSRRQDDRRRFKRPDRDSDDEGDYRHSSSSSYSSRNRRREGERDRRRSRSRDRRREPESSGWRKRRDSPKRSRSSPERDPKQRFSTHDTRESIPASSSSIRAETSKVSSKSSAVVDKHEPEVSEEEKEEIPKVLTDKEMNELGAKLLKAEMLGNVDLMEELKRKISEAESARQNFIKNGGDISNPQAKSTKVVTKVLMDSSKGRKKDKVTETHKDGQRVRYFPDDDRHTLKNMFQREKTNTAADENALFARLAGKGAKTGLDYDIDDVFTDKASSSKQAAKEQEREVRDVLDQEKEYKKVIDNCQWCFDGKILEKHLILSVAEKCYLCVPPYQSLSEGHCLIVPMSHASSATELDEDVWAEIQKFRKALVRMFRELDQDMVIFETALFLKRHPHMYLECVPMPKETGELAPIYFKKAIQECETEWSHNKKLVELRNRDVRRAVPKGLPYFSVDFGDDSCGFAHVIEDERNFPRNFAHEIVGGMMELDHHLWRKQKKDDFKTQRNKVMEFLKHWGPFDWTRDPN